MYFKQDEYKILKQSVLRHTQKSLHAQQSTFNSKSQTGLQNKQNSEIKVLVIGPTGYIGKFVTKELISQGYSVVAFARSKSGVGGGQSEENTVKDFDGANVIFGDVTNPNDIEEKAFKQNNIDVVVSCIASRTGGKKDSWTVDYQVNSDVLKLSQNNGVKQFILLSAICVQKPLLEFQKAKLKFEAELRQQSNLSYSIVRPTAFFKSLAGQIEIVQKGGPYMLVGDGTLASCKPISEQDLAKYLISCIKDSSKLNQILPIGGPGQAYNTLQQSQLLFKLLDKKAWTLSIPVGLFDVIIGAFEFLNRFFPQLEDSVEFGKIGKYYATESMLVYDQNQQQYDEKQTPSYGQEDLTQFFSRVIKEGLKGQELGDAAIFK